jgi:hypothetical protein
MEALVDQRMKEMEASWKTQRTDVARVFLVNDDFLRENLRRFVARGYFQNSNSFSKKQPGTGGEMIQPMVS